jgi:hypothetical protein
MLLINKIFQKKKNYNKYEPTRDTNTSKKLSLIRFGRGKKNSNIEQKIVTSDTYEEASTVCVSQISGMTPPLGIGASCSERRNEHEVIDMDITTSLMVISDPVDLSFEDDGDEPAGILMSRSFEGESLKDHPQRMIHPSISFDDEGDDNIMSYPYSLPMVLTSTLPKRRISKAPSHDEKRSQKKQTPILKPKTRAPAFPIDLDTSDSWHHDPWLNFVQERQKDLEWVDDSTKFPAAVADLPSFSITDTTILEAVADLPSFSITDTTIPASSDSIEVVFPESSTGISDPESPLILPDDLNENNEDWPSEDIPGYAWDEDVDEARSPESVMGMLDSVCTGKSLQRHVYAEKLHQDTLNLVGFASDKLRNLDPKSTIFNQLHFFSEHDNNSIVSEDTIKHNNGNPLCSAVMTLDEYFPDSSMGSLTCKFFDTFYNTSGQGQGEI